jgi:hypothetical protein
MVFARRFKYAYQKMQYAQEVAIPQFGGNIIVRINFDEKPPVFVRVYVEDIPHMTLGSIAPPNATIFWRFAPTYNPYKTDRVYAYLMKNPNYVFVDITFDGVIVLRYIPKDMNAPQAETSSARSALVVLNKKSA